MIINKVFYNFSVNFTPRKRIEEVVIDNEFVTFKVYDESGHIEIRRTNLYDPLLKKVLLKKKEADKIP